MKKVTLTFPTGLRVQASIMVEREPALAADFLGKLANGPQTLVCNHAVCAGKIFDAYMRYDSNPTQAIAGQCPVTYAQLTSGDLLWDGEKLSVVYGEVMQPGTAGCVIGKADNGPVFDKACLNVWYDIYREHTVSMITIAEE